MGSGVFAGGNRYGSGLYRVDEPGVKFRQGKPAVDDGAG